VTVPKASGLSDEVEPSGTKYCSHTPNPAPAGRITTGLMSAFTSALRRDWVSQVVVNSGAERRRRWTIEEQLIYT
jgi:hypothetical protein